MLNILNVGLEHLQSGLEFDNLAPICFEQDGPTTFVVWSLQPFKAKWTLADRKEPIVLQSCVMDYNPPMPDTMNLVREKVERNDMLKGGNHLNGMEVLCRTEDTVFLRIPRKLQDWSNLTGMNCSCETCKDIRARDDWDKNDHSKWDTLAVPRNPPTKNQADFSHTVHMPNGTVPQSIEYWRKKGVLVERKRK